MPAKTFVPTLATGAVVSLAAMVAWRKGAAPATHGRPPRDAPAGTVTKAIAVLHPTKDKWRGLGHGHLHPDGRTASRSWPTSTA